MNVIVINNTEAKALHKRFAGWFEIQPIPIKDSPLGNNMWVIPADAILDLKAMIVDKYGDNANIITKARAVWNNLKDRTIYDLDDYPQYQYDVSGSAIETSPDKEAYRLRFLQLDPREDIS